MSRVIYRVFAENAGLLRFRGRVGPQKPRRVSDNEKP